MSLTYTRMTTQGDKYKPPYKTNFDVARKTKFEVYKDLLVSKQISQESYFEKICNLYSFDPKNNVDGNSSVISDVSDSSESSSLSDNE